MRKRVDKWRVEILKNLPNKGIGNSMGFSREEIRVKKPVIDLLIAFQIITMTIAKMKAESEP